MRPAEGGVMGRDAGASLRVLNRRRIFFGAGCMVAAALEGEGQSFSMRGRGETIVECGERDPFAGLALQVQAAGELYSVA